MIGAVVLAAGRGLRIGGPKATLAVDSAGMTFAGAVLATLREAGVETIRVVVAPGHRLAEGDLVENPDPSRGMLSSVQCGLRALPAGIDAVLVWPVDHPLVRTETVTAMIARFRSGRAPVIVPSHRGRRGHPALFAAETIPELFTARPEEGARAVVHAHADRVEFEVDDPGVVNDIDTPEEYARAIGRPLARSTEAP